MLQVVRRRHVRLMSRVSRRLRVFSECWEDDLKLCMVEVRETDIINVKAALLANIAILLCIQVWQLLALGLPYLQVTAIFCHIQEMENWSALAVLGLATSTLVFKESLETLKVTCHVAHCHRPRYSPRRPSASPGSSSSSCWATSPAWEVGPASQLFQEGPSPSCSTP